MPIFGARQDIFWAELRVHNNGADGRMLAQDERNKGRKNTHSIGFSSPLSVSKECHLPSQTKASRRTVLAPSPVAQQWRLEA
ncbi:hypothetical protein [Rhizobium sp. PDO1-076]|uniref:hypothetical protein n=1 Tax=Rhizobium sp. PDO1-076 TaxID=1125979 RepID=UPI001147462B|nr:hypothetical protein [Rhizobium sp. PDO1-076]